LPRTLEPCIRDSDNAPPGPLALAVVALALAATLAVPAPSSAQSASDPASGPVYGHKGESSLGILFGVGWYDNTDFNEALAEIGVPIENGFEYGLQYRKRLSHYVSLGAELGRWDGRSNTLEGGGGFEFGLAGTPLFLDGFVHPLQVGGCSLTLFAGGGPVFAIRLSETDPGGYVVEGKKTGFGWQAGAEGEARFGENFGFFIRGMTRRAGVDDIFLVTLGDGTPVIFDADFDGLAVTFGPRWHWGGQGGGAP
jgi:hypothetical protein